MSRCSGPAGCRDGRGPRSSSGVALNRRLPDRHTARRAVVSTRLDGGVRVNKLQPGPAGQLPHTRVQRRL